MIEETGLLPHLNPGVMSYEEIARLKQVSASMGIMLETSSERLAASAAGRTSARPTRCPRSGCARSRTPAASRSRSRPASSSASARPPASGPSRCSRSATLHRRYRHVQEVIVQNFRAKPGTAMHGVARAGRRGVPRGGRDRPGRARTPDAPAGPAEPVGPAGAAPAARCRASTTGAGSRPLTPDHVNPEKPWPSIEALGATDRRARASSCASA